MLDRAITADDKGDALGDGEQGQFDPVLLYDAARRVGNERKFSFEPFTKP